MKKALAIIAAIFLSLVVSWPFIEAALFSQALHSIHNSHIEGNTPDGQNFDTFLKRDLKAYFQETNKNITDVQYYLLRDNATQVGVSYPKYYVWAKALADNQVVQEGAAELMAMDKTAFAVNSFILRSDIEAKPELLAPDLLARAGIKH